MVKPSIHEVMHKVLDPESGDPIEGEPVARSLKLTPEEMETFFEWFRGQQTDDDSAVVVEKEKFKN